MHRFIAVLAIATMSCSSGNGDGQATTAEADAIVLGLSHQDIALTVFSYNEWLIGHSKECKSLKGKLANSEMAELKLHMTDKAIKSLGRECDGDSYRITIGLSAPVCSPIANIESSPGLSGLIAFFEDKAAKLEQEPAGKCGEPQTTTPSNWPNAGSGA